MKPMIKLKAISENDAVILRVVVEILKNVQTKSDLFKMKD
jgi:hypothetical protein